MKKKDQANWQLINHDAVGIRANLFTGSFLDCVQYIADHPAALVLTKVDRFDKKLYTTSGNRK